MNKTANKQIINSINILLPIILICDYLSCAFFRTQIWFDLIAVIVFLIIFVQLMNIRYVQATDVFFTALAFFLIIITSDISFVSILCVYIMYSVRVFSSKKLIKNCFRISVLCLSLIVLSYLIFGFNSECDTEIYRPLQNITVPRKCFGFAHPNQFTIYLLSITVFVYLLTDKLKYYFTITLIDCVFFYYTQSRTVLYVVLFLLIANIISRVLKLKNIKNRYFVPCVFLFVCIISFVLSLYFSGSKLDVLLTGRLTLNKKYLASGLTFFGDSSFDGKPFDNSYVHMLLTKGVLYFLVYNGLMLIMLYKSKMSWSKFIILSAILLESFMEVIFLKYCFMIIIPILCNNEVKLENDTQNNTLLLVRQKSKV